MPSTPTSHAPADQVSGDGADRRRRSTEVVSELRHRWERGEATDDAWVIASHSDLMPELAEELSTARMVRAALVAARKAGPSQAHEQLRVLSEEEINAPIIVPDDVI